jgi:hypothetical protein
VMGRGAGRGRGMDLNKPAWMTTGDLGKPPAAVMESASATAEDDKMAADLRAFAAGGSAGGAASGGSSTKPKREREDHDGRTRSKGQLADEDTRFSNIPMLELQQLMAVISGPHDSVSASREELVVSLRAAVPNVRLAVSTSARQAKSARKK